MSRKICTRNSSIWRYFKNEKEEIKHLQESCKKNTNRREDPDLEHLGGTAYRTCGSAYIIQKDLIPSKDKLDETESKILRKIEADFSIKDSLDDPMPAFRTVEQRLIDLAERKLHPFYKKYMWQPKAHEEDEPQPKLQFPYKCKTGPIEPKEIPIQLQLSQQFLERKNIFVDFKGVELPQQMVVRMVEMEKNKRPTLEKRPTELLKK